MSNPLFEALGKGRVGNGIMPAGGNNPMEMMQKFVDFKNKFSGNPKEEVQKMLQSGRLTQQQLNQAQQMARQFQQMMGGLNK